MKPFKQLLRRLACFLVGLLISYCLSYGLQPMGVSSAQVTVTNQASAQFDDGTGTTRTTNSNQTAFQLAGQQQAGGLEIIKTADRSAAEPGDVVVYRLLVRNRSSNAATPLTVSDQLPLGLQYVANSVQSSPLQATSITVNGRQLTFQFASLAGGQELTITYAVLLTPDAIRGSGRNVAQAAAPGFATVLAPFQLTIRPGILSDCGTILGRVFVDKNFDGEQQSGEPGVPNAVIFMEDGNRILTDPNGLFSLANALSGNRVGTLDLTSLPGYTLAPNLYRIDTNSQSRLVRLEPGGLARMNFAVTPTFGEGEP